MNYLYYNTEFSQWGLSSEHSRSNLLLKHWTTPWQLIDGINELINRKLNNSWKVLLGRQTNRKIKNQINFRYLLRSLHRFMVSLCHFLTIQATTMKYTSFWISRIVVFLSNDLFVCLVQSRPLFIPAALGIAGKKRVQYNLHAHVS